MLIAILAAGDFLLYNKVYTVLANKKWIRWMVFLVLGLLVALFSKKGSAAEFVYFQF